MFKRQTQTPTSIRGWKIPASVRAYEKRKVSFLTNREIENSDKIKVNPIVISRPESAAAAAKLRVQPPDTQLPTPQAACQTEIDAAVGGGEAAAAVGTRQPHFVGPRLRSSNSSSKIDSPDSEGIFQDHKFICE